MSETNPLIIKFVQEFAHALRTPLSVVLHELQYTEQTSNCDNIPKALSKTNDIIALLKEVTDLFSANPPTHESLLSWVRGQLELSDADVELSGSCLTIRSERFSSISKNLNELGDLAGVVPGLTKLKAAAADIVMSMQNWRLKAEIAQDTCKIDLL